MASVVDTAFAGHLGEISVDALTTMGLLSPVLSVYTAFQALFAVSTSIMIAKYLKDQTVREEYLITGLCMTFFVSSRSIHLFVSDDAEDFCCYRCRRINCALG